MVARTATNERILIWTLDRTARQSKRDDQDLLAEISGLANEHSALLFRVAFSVLRHAGDAEDVVQETFLRVLKHRNKLSSVENTRVWLIRIAWNLALDRKRRLRSMPLVEETEEILKNRPGAETAADVALSAAENCASVFRLMDKLPHKEREVLRLSAMEELETSEIAAILKTTESSVRSRLFRARQRLRERLEKEGERRP
jgi:RNA polymerase sigma-70 factor (ECF subfamily)